MNLYYIQDIILIMRVVKGIFNASRRPISQIGLKSRYGNFERIALGLTIMSVFYQIHLSFRNEVRENLGDFKKDYEKSLKDFKRDQRKLDQEVTTGFQRMEMLIKEVRIEQKEQAREIYSKPSN